jgi:hypothetical protein
MTDLEFTSSFESCTLPEDQFRHRDHVRLAWIYLLEYGRERAAEIIAASIRRYAASLGKADRYHHTITKAWLELVWAVKESLPDDATFEDAVDCWPKLLQKGTLAEYYSSGVLESDTARREFVAPDLQPLLVTGCANGSIAGSLRR